MTPVTKQSHLTRRPTFRKSMRTRAQDAPSATQSVQLLSALRFETIEEEYLQIGHLKLN